MLICAMGLISFGEMEIAEDEKRISQDYSTPNLSFLSFFIIVETRHVASVRSWELWSGELPITNYQLPITNYQLPITNGKISVCIVGARRL
ncbi:MAG: hypothetical protein QNJ47_06715 [Nostocaceae cyanobacterium]|nr:hypothetical protein [Nostocaceae cyanobacterium]